MTARSRSTCRDREGTFEPRRIPKHERRFTGFDDKILALYVRGMTKREIQAFLAEMYAVEGLTRSDQHGDRWDRRRAGQKGEATTTRITTAAVAAAP
jgi:Transposase, Mutator family